MIGLAGGRWRLRGRDYGRPGECSQSGVLRGIRPAGLSCQWRVVEGDGGFLIRDLKIKGSGSLRFWYTKRMIWTQ